MGGLIDYREQVALAARAVTVRSESSYAWFGRPSPRWARSDLPPALIHRHLILQLQQELYRSFYVRGVPVPDDEESSPHSPDSAFIESLSAANASRGGWDSGWSLIRREGSVLVLERGGLRLHARTSDCSARHAASSISVRRAPESRKSLPGFLLIHGDTSSEAVSPDIEVRLYFQLPASSAPALVSVLTGRLNSDRVPFDLKLITDPTNFDRPDAAVLYLEAECFARASPSLRAVLVDCAGALRDAAPPFTKPLARGLAVAEHVPAEGGSFGTSRCRLVAEGLVDAYKIGARTVTERVDAVASRFEAAGLSLDRPYLGPGSGDRYVI